MDDSTITSILTWLISSCLIGAWGSSKKIGFKDSLMICLVLSPIFGLILTAKSPNKKITTTCLNCQWEGELTTSMDRFCPRCGMDNIDEIKTYH